MKILLSLILAILSIGAICQDDYLDIRISKLKSLPQIGIGYDGAKYFVMSTNQSKEVLIALSKGVYADSVLIRYEELQKILEAEVYFSNERIHDLEMALSKQDGIIGMMQEDINDVVAQNLNLNKNIKDMRAHIKSQKRAITWGAILATLVGGALLINSTSN